MRRLVTALTRITRPALSVMSLSALVLPSAAGMAASAAWNDAVRPVPWPEVVLQSLPSSCGPALIATLASWRGADVAERTVIAQTRLGDDGVSLAEFARLAALHGLDGTWYHVAAARLAGVPVPFVAHLDEAAGGHYVAVVAINRAQAVIVDPAAGALVGPTDTLLRAFSGRVFVLAARVP